MVYCSHCGTQNREGSKFCNTCGARLTPESGLHCPMCSTPNPVENVFCFSCGARLVPLTAAALPETNAPAPPIKGLSLPTKPKAPDESSEPEEPGASVKPESVAPLSTDDLPDWIARLRRRESEAEPAPPAKPEVEANMPDWIARLREQPAEDSQARQPEARSEEQIPDWMKGLSEEAPAQPHAAPAADEGIPDWLKLPLETESAKETRSSGAEGDKPDWLKQPEPTPEAGAPSIDEEQLPDWLKQPAVESAKPAGEAEAEPVKVAEAEKKVETIKLADARKPEAEPQIKAREELEPPKLSDSQASFRPATAPAPEGKPPQPGQVPAWVTAKPMVLSAAQPVPNWAADQLEMAGPLQGLRGVLPLAATIAEPHKIAETPQPRPSEGGQIFESILATPPPAPPAAKPARFVLTMRPFIYLLLFLAVLIPFLLPYDLTQSTFNIAGTPAAEFYDTLQKIPANSTVLLSFDYDPSLAGEMDLQATAIARDLIRRGVKIIAVSTLDTGPQIAQRILNPIASQAGNYKYGSSYLIVYLPGHEAGLAQLASAGLAPTTDFVDQKSVAQFLTAAKIRNLSDLSMVIELAGTEEPLKTWVEQVQPRVGVRIAAAVSAAVEPKARAYRNAHQLTALMAGLLGAAQFEVLDNQPGLAVISVNAQTAAQFVIVFFIVLGNIVFWISRARGKAK